MDYISGNSKSENYNPRETASIFSLATFFYNYGILKKGKKKDIEEKDIFRVLPQFEAESLGDKLEYKWKQEKKRSKNASIATCLTKCFGWTYLCYAVVQLTFSTAVILLTPLTFSKFVAYFEPGQTSLTTRDAFKYAFAIIGLNLFNVFYNNHFVQLVIEYSMRVRTAVCSLIYRKALKLSPIALGDVSIGKVVTLMSKDVLSIDSGLMFLKDAIIGLLQLAVVSYILYQKVGVSAFPAVGVILVIIPIQLFTGKKTMDCRIETAKKTDSRFKLLQETLSAIKIIKMYTWRDYFEKLIHKARLIETDKIKIVYYLKAFIVSLGGSAINIAFYALIVSYIATGNNVDAETIYYAQACLGTIRMSIALSIPLGIAQVSDMIAALSRIRAFLNAKEIKKPLRNPTKNPKLHLSNVQVVINNKEILKSVSLNITNQGLLLIAGNVGSGKSALLKTILGEYPVSEGDLITEGTFSYATEEPWLFPSTIRQNILFGQPFNERKYQEVLNMCALTYDINQFDKMDQTIVGDRGINLSKGQQARISLARAIYKDSDIYLIDDCLSSVDNHVNKHIFNECIRKFLKEKICLFVTNNINNIKTVNNSDILFIENGATLTLDQQRDALDKRITYYIDEDNIDNKWKESMRISQLNDEESISEDFNEIDNLLESNGHSTLDENLYHETKKEGKVLWNNYVRFFRFIGGIFVTIYMLVVFAAAQFCASYSDKLISLWVNLEPKITNLTLHNLTNTSDYQESIKSREQFFNIYTILTVGMLIMFLLRSYSSFFFCMNGARKLHRAMVKSMLSAYMYFYDDHFIGNIINRLSKDFHIIDEYIPFLVFEWYRLFFAVVGVFILVATVNWTFFIPAAFLLVKLVLMQKLYQPAGRSLRRLEATTRSPIIGYLNSTLEGLAIIRASEQQNKLQAEFDKHQDLFTSTSYMNTTTSRFFQFVLDISGVFFMVGIIMKLVVFPEGAKPGDVGLAISQATMLSMLLQYTVKQLTEIENVMTSIERVFEYTDVKGEPKAGKTPTNWPSNGNIRFNDVSLTYKTDGKTVLKNISFEIEGQMKVGIVGRTGAGKSSIISSLFRLYNFDGQISIDDENINGLSLDYLRSHISLIPQDPVLFSGTIRTNIDPFNKYSDADIWKALGKVHMKSSVTSLNKIIDDLSATYSSGQKQLICLARALVQNNKIIVLDEATANLDPETDQLLQKTVKECFVNCTVITIAHRLHSVLSCDKVLVLDAGRIVEYDEPDTLLENANGYLYKMVKEESCLSL
ncbi:unnamed protein product [Ceutorhynchus assimilis]|uniref:Uncharacterized protein n=1 Tax=Ceutorhynchus assimilis TaxID=467358 RepID=A0A9N9MU59_9CUCU|nr:unnamed protein product [Ceutorhynchus assimilis]